MGPLSHASSMKGMPGLAEVFKEKASGRGRGCSGAGEGEERLADGPEELAAEVLLDRGQHMGLEGFAEGDMGFLDAEELSGGGSGSRLGHGTSMWFR